MNGVIWAVGLALFFAQAPWIYLLLRSIQNDRREIERLRAREKYPD